MSYYDEQRVARLEAQLEHARGDRDRALRALYLARVALASVLSLREDGFDPTLLRRLLDDDVDPTLRELVGEEPIARRR